MRHRRTIFLSGIMLLLSAIALAGCKGATKTGTPYTVLPSRAIQAYLTGNLVTVHQTAVKVLRDDYLFTITRESHDALEGIIEAKTARNDTVRVETFKHSDTSTKTRVFVGMIGDEKLAADILSKIEESLPSAEK